MKNYEYAEIAIEGSNCTFMELKFPLSNTSWSHATCSNCTFMELKYLMWQDSGSKIPVLIVPLWN